MRYVLANNAGQRLSGFYPNDVRVRLVYRRNDYYCYSTLAEAESHLRYIQNHGVGKNLKIQVE